MAPGGEPIEPRGGASGAAVRVGRSTATPSDSVGKVPRCDGSLTRTDPERNGSVKLVVAAQGKITVVPS